MQDLVYFIHQNPFLTAFLVLVLVSMTFKFIVNVIRSLRGDEIDNNYE